MFPSDFTKSVKKLVEDIKTEEIDVVIGIPFINEKETLEKLLKTAQNSVLSKGDKKIIFCAADPAGKEIVEGLRACEKDGIYCFAMPEAAKGKGFSIRAIFEVARLLESDVVLLEADLESGEKGITSRCIENLYKPVARGYDMAVASFARSPFEETTGKLFVSPLLAAFYGTSISDPLGGVCALSHDLVEDLCKEFDQHTELLGGYGITPWLVMAALKWGKKICEVKLGPKLSAPSLYQKRNVVFKAVARTVFECILRDEELWPEDLLVRKPDVFEMDGEIEPEAPWEELNIETYLESFKKNFQRYEQLLDLVLDKETKEALKEISAREKSDFEFSAELWSRVALELLTAFATNEKVLKEDIIDALAGIYDGRIVGYAKEILELDSALKKIGVDEREIVDSKAQILIRAQEKAFLNEKKSFKVSFDKKREGTRPLITPLDYLEFVPGVPIVLPKRLKGYRGREIFPKEIFKKLQGKYSLAFEGYIKNVLGIKEESPERIAEGFANFLGELEKAVDRIFPGDLHSEEGLNEVCRRIFELFPHRKVLGVKWEVLRKLLYEFPPRNLLVRFNFRNMRELMDNLDVRDALTLAQFTESPEYFNHIYEWLQDNLRPDSFEEVELRPLVLDRKKIPVLNDWADISRYSRLTARIAVVGLGKGMGGKYPKLRYFTRLAKSIIEAEHYSIIWKIYARERREVGQKFVNSITKHYGREIFSAHRIFENWHHRELAARLKELARNLKDAGRIEEGDYIYKMAEGHGLGLTLEDGTYLPCSAWTWASFSFKGGEGVPTPLSLHVERDWFSHDLMEEIYKEMGYDTDEILNQVFQLISLGRENQDLLDILLGIKPPKEEVVVQELEEWPPAGKLERYEKNPILSPIREHWWESKYVLNAAALRLKDKVYLLYRAYGQDEVSRIGLAITDGYNVLERLKHPIFVPETKEEIKGCEDPRVVVIDDEIVMLYTAYDGVVAQIAAASISVEDFLNRNFDRWKRKGLAFPGIWDKDAILFPEKIKGNYAIYHRIEPSIWVAYSEKLAFPWPHEGHKIIMGPRSGMMWDSLKIGAGAQPIKTEFGWLLIYHGVDQEMVYRLGVVLADFDDPGRVLYRSPNPILSPEEEYEVGKKGESWVPNVVFTCGAVPAEEKEILGENDEILVYYGAADTSICLAKGRVGDLIPEEVRRRLKGNI
nr:MAG: glycosidase [Bacillota bacterium]